MTPLEHPDVLEWIKQRFAPDGAAEREHNAAPWTLGFGAIHYGLVVNLRPQRTLVVGSRHGYIPAVIGLALQATGGTLDFVDANYSDAAHGFEAAYGGVGHWGDDAAASRFGELELGDRLRLHVMESSRFFGQCDATYDYVYLDGNHSYEGCRFDFEQSVARASSRAVVALHDVLVTDPAFGVQRLFEELDPARFGKILIPAWPGLGLVQCR